MGRATSDRSALGADIGMKVCKLQISRDQNLECEFLRMSSLPLGLGWEAGDGRLLFRSEIRGNLASAFSRLSIMIITLGLEWSIATWLSSIDSEVPYL